MQETLLKSILTGVYVLTVQDQGNINGTTVAWATPVSYEPLLVMASMAGIRASHDMIKNSGYFGLNVLKADQVDLARNFGFQSGRDVDKFDGVNFTTSEHGLPVLKDARGFIECRLVSAYPAGDHTLFVGEVISASVFDEETKPLAFSAEDYF